MINLFNKYKKINVPNDLEKELYDYEHKNDLRFSKKTNNDEIRFSFGNNNITDDSNVIKDLKEEIDKAKNNKSFHDLLFSHIIKKNLSNINVYKKADIDRKLFSKIQVDFNYHPTYGTLTSLALALELTLDEYKELLNSASYSLSSYRKCDVVIKYCFTHKIYDVYTVNNLLYTTCDIVLKNIR